MLYHGTLSHSTHKPDFFLCSKEEDQGIMQSSSGKLKARNEKFVGGGSTHPDETPNRIRALKKGQYLCVVVVSCSDSCIQQELIFNQGLGDIFPISTAGNIVRDYELGSIEYAIERSYGRTKKKLSSPN